MSTTDLLDGRHAAVHDHDVRRNALLWAGLNLSGQNLHICTHCDTLIDAGVCTGCTEEGIE